MNWYIKRFEDLSIEQLYSILKLRNDVFIVEQQCPYEDCDDKDKNAYHLFLEDNKELIAYLRILNKGVSFDEISIGRVLVNKKFRGNGFSREMMHRAVDFVEGILHEGDIRISAQAYLVNFYRSLGFEAVSEVYLEDNIPHIEMLYSNKDYK